MTSTPPGSVVPDGWWRHRLVALRLPADSVGTTQQPVTSSGRRRHCRWPPRPQHPRRQRLVPCCRLAEQRLASLESNGAQCILQRLTMAINLRHVFSRRPLTEITPPSGNKSPSCIQNELVLARFTRRVSKKPCKPLFGNTHSENLARKGPFSSPRSPNHTQQANLAVPFSKSAQIASA